MAEPTDFIAGEELDMFDPNFLDVVEAEAQKVTESIDEQVRHFISRRKEAYVRVFTAGATDQADIDIVLNDLMHFCRAFRPTFNAADGIHADTLMKIKEGRREVAQRIMDFSRLDSDALLKKYTDYTTR